MHDKSLTDDPEVAGHGHVSFPLPLLGVSVSFLPLLGIGVAINHVGEARSVRHLVRREQVLHRVLPTFDLRPSRHEALKDKRQFVWFFLN